MRRHAFLPLALALAATLPLAACSDAGEGGVVGTWRAAADTVGPGPSVLYEFRPDHTMVLHMRAQNTETRGDWLRGPNEGIRIVFGEDSYFAGREMDGRLVAPDSLVLEIRGRERVFVPHDTAAAGEGP